MKQQTAVDFLLEQIRNNKFIGASEQIEVIYAAKEMEKQQIMIAYLKNLPIEDGVLTAVQKAELYYNETYKSK